MAIRINEEYRKIKETNLKHEAGYNCIVYGKSGVGKTYSIRTARKPVHIDSFDPGGTDVLHDLIKKDIVIPDKRYEFEDPFQPKAFARWMEQFDKRYNGGYFDYIGTYVLDSATTWAQCVMYYILNKDRRAGKQPFQQDWLPQMTYIENYCRKMLSMECDTILICHEDIDKDEMTGAIERAPLLTGKLKTRIPLLFSEIYHTTLNVTKDGKMENFFQTVNYDRIVSRTRLGKGGLLKVKEKADYKSIQKKVGRLRDDLPNFEQLSEERK